MQNLPPNSLRKILLLITAVFWGDYHQLRSSEKSTLEIMCFWNLSYTGLLMMKYILIVMAIFSPATHILLNQKKSKD
ncbi:hypothetical protein EAO82_08805 [Halopseudomonas pelagia]|uniref:Uncharacterized protein n=2 Tax=Halopseudomonas pelagia TaxID=553151 RepID=A0ABX6CQA0_9GAMM|nr:hypothetical protein EAO82_08805 [Halopseudomonas pelagia]